MPTLFKVLNPFSFGELPYHLNYQKDIDFIKGRYELNNTAKNFIEAKLKAFDIEYLHAKTHAHKKNIKIASDHFRDSITKYMEATITKKFFEENSDFKTSIDIDNKKNAIRTQEKELETIRKNYFSSSAYFPVDLDNLDKNKNLSYRMSDAVIEAIAIISFLAIAGGIALFIATNIPATLILGFAASMAFIVTAGYSTFTTNSHTNSIEKDEKALFQEIDKQCRKKIPETTYDLDAENEVMFDVTPS